MSAATLPASIPSPISSAASTSPVPPPTPLTPNSAHGVSFASQTGSDQFSFDALHLDTNTGAAAPAPTNGGPARRKPSRRANTAERRATHNMVERQRREALNGRFLDLAALLPNLASVRRPSKSAIVNSSIALIHTQRRARATAARELRMLKLESDHLRAELNEWRERAGMNLARIEEPPRSREFEELVSGGLEEAEENLLEEERRALEIVKEGLRLDASAMGEMMVGGQFAFNMGGNGLYGLAEDDDDDSSDGQPAHLRPRSQGSANGMALPMPIPIPRQNSINANPMIFDPTSAMLQAHSTHNAGITAFPSYDLSGAPQAHPSLNLAKQQLNAGWNTPIYSALSGSYPQQTMFTPPASAAGSGFLAGFGLRDDDDASSTHSGSVPDMTAYSAVHPGLAAHRTRSASTITTLQTKNLNVVGTATPPSSAPPTATTYAEAAGSAGDMFAAAYNAGFPLGSARVAGGGNTYGAAMGLFM